MVAKWRPYRKIAEEKGRVPRQHKPVVQQQGHRVPGLQAEPRKNRGVKNKITINEGCAPIIVVKLLRTDTTLDLSQKARVVKFFVRRQRGIYSRSTRTDHDASTNVTKDVWSAPGHVSSAVGQPDYISADTVLCDSVLPARKFQLH